MTFLAAALCVGSLLISVVTYDTARGALRTARGGTLGMHQRERRRAYTWFAVTGACWLTAGAVWLALR